MWRGRTKQENVHTTFTAPGSEQTGMLPLCLVSAQQPAPTLYLVYISRSRKSKALACVVSCDTSVDAGFAASQSAEMAEGEDCCGRARGIKY